MIWRRFLGGLLVASLSMGPTIGIATEAEVASDGLSVKSVPNMTLRDKKWIHGSADCDTNKDPAIEVFQYDQSSYILRQNKCLSFEAPFVYLLIGDEKVLLLDTGATEDALEFPLYETVRSLIPRGLAIELELLVVHSHSHSDHYAGDSQFEGQPNVTVVQPNSAAVTEFFGFRDWPKGEAEIELGNRKLAVIPTPGHQEEAIAVYDPHTKWLLTGDTFYPGLVYVKNWDEYKRSIARLVSFSKTHDIKSILGAHIEMTVESGEHYSIGTTYQPNEASLSLTLENLVSVNSALGKSGDAQKIVMDDLIVIPMNAASKSH